MNRGHRGRNFVLGAVTLMAFLAAGCSDDGSKATTDPDVGRQPAGALLAYAGCKDFNTANLMEEPGPGSDCVAYTFSEGTLEITHGNAGFNCCQDEIVATITIADGVITITEAEIPQGGLCDCDCLYDVTYEITDLTAGEYRIEFIEPYVRAEHEALQFTVDLVTTPAGSHCVTRTHYPWGVPGQ